MKKRGSHVGFVLSFIVFVTFLIFIYSALEPSIKTSNSKQNSLKKLQDNLISHIQEEYQEISISINYGLTECIKISNIEIMNLLEGKNIVVKSSEDFLDYEKSPNYVEIKRSSEDFLKIITSENFEENNKNLQDCENVDAKSKIVLYNKKKEIFKSRILEVFQEYELDYEGLKIFLGISKENEIGFIFNSTEINLATELPRNIQTEVYSNKKSVIYLDEKANIKKGNLTFYVW